MAVEIVSKLKQKNQGKFKLIDLADVDYDGNGSNAKEIIDESMIELVEDDADIDFSDGEYPNLDTNEKTIIGGINELNLEKEKLIKIKAESDYIYYNNTYDSDNDYYKKTLINGKMKDLAIYNNPPTDPNASLLLYVNINLTTLGIKTIDPLYNMITIFKYKDSKGKDGYTYTTCYYSKDAGVFYARIADGENSDGKFRFMTSCTVNTEIDLNGNKTEKENNLLYQLSILRGDKYPGSINILDNLEIEVYLKKVDVLKITGDNGSFVPTKDYQPSTKKYVDDLTKPCEESEISDMITELCGKDYSKLEN